jgi:hypothetical protein
MNTFIGWRDAAAVMRWARQQEGVKVSRGRFGLSVDNRWCRDGDTRVTITHIRGLRAGIGVDIDMPGAEAELVGDSAQQIIDLLAALGLIPVTFTSGYRTGYVNARMDLAAQLHNAAQAYAVIHHTGKDAYPTCTCGFGPEGHHFPDCPMVGGGSRD